ncbi:PHB depolymerase family esterase [Streptomyces sp. 110]|uniref:PHB depolymerase family esterase n=1 Tax=Streptomyces endocoffeicus TaxID=2898945 RepID=A0ABS1Q1T0_9ACTN|nr:PHB depolymerase family esterase [Streptomyces endocoffeicus]MBL1118623.1 PHB depolymerase family esterase [Streptomyces endocoffeicus]
MRFVTVRRVLRRTALAAALGALATGMTVITPLAPVAAAAADGTLQQVTNFGSNPGNLAMYEYAPTNLPANAPLVVALHGCTQSASDYHTHSGWQKFADQWGFAVVYPQTGPANNGMSCFSWFDATKDTRGKGEAASIVQMVDHATAQYGSDRGRIFVTGLSAGGGMTANLLADYPDVFAGGAVDSGLPAQCATTVIAASSCQYSGQNLTPEQWGDKVRGSYPGYTGPWPRVAIWQGTSDTTVTPVNGTELRDQWTDVWGISQTPSSTRDLTGGTTESIYNDSAGKPAVAHFSISGMAHGLAVDPGSGADQCGTTGTYYIDSICSSYHTARFWGLDGSGSGSLPGPSGVTVTGTTDDGVSLSWNAVSGAASYNVYRDGTKVGSPTNTSYTDTGLSAGASYRYTVAAVDSTGAVGAASSPVTATTTGAEPAPRCYTDNNYNQVKAGRAHQSLGHTYANGSNQNLGLYNLAVTHTLKETSPGYFVLADSGC